MEDYLTDIFTQAITKILNTANVNHDTSQLIRSGDLTPSKHSDYQYNGLMRLVHQTKGNPKTIADQIIGFVLDLDNQKIIQSMRFNMNYINLMIKNNYLYRSVWMYGSMIQNNGLENLQKSIRLYILIRYI